MYQSVCRCFCRFGSHSSQHEYFGDMNEKREIGGSPGVRTPSAIHFTPLHSTRVALVLVQKTQKVGNGDKINALCLLLTHCCRLGDKGADSPLHSTYTRIM
ncbi:hypothetical protein DMENIID0001_041130 [Sergentomyia squamirostris]